MNEKLLVVAFTAGLPIVVGLITKWAITHDIVFRIWPPMIKIEKNGHFDSILRG